MSRKPSKFMAFPPGGDTDEKLMGRIRAALTPTEYEELQEILRFESEYGLGEADFVGLFTEETDGDEYTAIFEEVLEHWDENHDQPLPEDPLQALQVIDEAIIAKLAQQRGDND